MKIKPQVIFFDVGNTLLFPNWNRILEPLTNKGIVPTAEQLRSIERKTKVEFDENVTSGKIDHGFWQLFYGHLLDLLGMDDQAVETALTEATRLSSNWDQILPGTREILKDVAGSFRTGIISNADGKIDKVLEVCGIGDCFANITDSGIVGHEKPHPAIFEAALRKMDVNPGNAVYVGDLYSVDYLGATSAGMHALLFDVSGAYRDRGIPRVESLKQLQTALAST